MYYIFKCGTRKIDFCSSITVTCSYSDQSKRIYRIQLFSIKMHFLQRVVELIFHPTLNSGTCNLGDMERQPDTQDIDVVSIEPIQSFGGLINYYYTVMKSHKGFILVPWITGH